MTTVEILRGARALLADPANWTQGAVARDADGFPCGEDDDSADALSPDARAWCAVGACDRVLGYGIRFDDPRLAALRAAMGSDETAIGPWNDSHTHGEVLAAFDRAIASVSE